MFFGGLTEDKFGALGKYFAIELQSQQKKGLLGCLFVWNLVSLCTWLSWDSLCRPWTHRDLPDTASWVLRLKAKVFILFFLAKVFIYLFLTRNLSDSRTNYLVIINMRLFKYLLMLICFYSLIVWNLPSLYSWWWYETWYLLGYVPPFPNFSKIGLS